MGGVRSQALAGPVIPAPRNRLSPHKSPSQRMGGFAGGITRKGAGPCRAGWGSSEPRPQALADQGHDRRSAPPTKGRWLAWAV